jgi:hypothetical protein
MKNYAVRENARERRNKRKSGEGGMIKLVGLMGLFLPLRCAAKKKREGEYLGRKLAFEHHYYSTFLET